MDIITRTQYLMEQKSSHIEYFLTDMDFPVLEQRVENNTFEYFEYCET